MRGLAPPGAGGWQERGLTMAGHTRDKIKECILADCPFCGEGGEDGPEYRHRLGEIRVECGCESAGPWEDSFGAAASAWNDVAREHNMHERLVDACKPALRKAEAVCAHCRANGGVAALEQCKEVACATLPFTKMLRDLIAEAEKE